MSEAEDVVRQKDEASRRLDELEGFMRDLRLGRGAGLEVRKISLLARVFGYGWAEAHKPEVMPQGMENEFYGFLSDKAAGVAEEVRGYEKRLNTLGGGKR